MNKAKSQFIHARRRAKERYDIFLSKEEYDELVTLIQDQKAETLYKQSNRISVKKITYKEQTLFVVYDNMRNTIVTFLYEDYIDTQAVKDYKKNIEKVKENNRQLSAAKSWEEVMGLTKKLQT